MTHIEYFKLQAKNLFKDYKTKTPFFDGVIGDYLYQYNPKFFDMDALVCDFDIDEENFTLMNAQHVIAYLAGFRKWTDLVKASDTQLELAKLLFDNQHKISIDDWEMYMADVIELNQESFDSDFWLEVFKEVFVNEEGHVNTFPDYRLNVTRERN